MKRYEIWIVLALTGIVVMVWKRKRDDAGLMANKRASNQPLPQATTGTVVVFIIPASLAKNICDLGTSVSASAQLLGEVNMKAQWLWQGSEVSFHREIMPFTTVAKADDPEALKCVYFALHLRGTNLTFSGDPGLRDRFFESVPAATVVEVSHELPLADVHRLPFRRL